MRPLVVLPADPEVMSIGGIASFVRGFVKFAPSDFEFGMVGVSSYRRPGHWAEIDFEGRRMWFLPLFKTDTTRRSSIPLALRFALAAARRRPDLRGWIPSLHRTGTHLVLRGYRGPAWRVVHITREGATGAGSESRWRRAPALLDRMEAAEFARMDRIYVVNRSALDEYRSRYPAYRQRFGFLPNWVDPDLFHPVDPAVLDERRRAAEQRYRLPAGSDILLYAGRLERVKDPLLLGDGMVSLIRRRPAARLLIVGDGTLRPALESRLAAAGAGEATRFLGIVSRPELAALMGVVDVVLVTSRSETGPTVGYEALASGVPLVMTRVGEVADLVERHGAGRVVKGRDPQELADGVVDVLQQPREELCQRATLAAAPYSAEQVLREVYDYQRELSIRAAQPH